MVRATPSGLCRLHTGHITGQSESSIFEGSQAPVHQGHETILREGPPVIGGTTSGGEFLTVVHRHCEGVVKAPP